MIHSNKKKKTQEHRQGTKGFYNIKYIMSKKIPFTFVPLFNKL